MSKRTKLLLKENNELEMQIQNEDNRQALTDITVYLRSANISPYYQEKVRRDIWEMIVDGEKRGKAAKEIIGENYRLFCDNVIAEIPKLSRKEHVLSLLRDTLLAANALLIIWFAFRFMEQAINANGFPYFTVTGGNIICGILSIIAAFSVFSAVSKNAFRSTLSNRKAFFALLSILLTCMCVNAFVQHSLFQIHALIVAGGIVALFAMYKILDAKLD